MRPSHLSPRADLDPDTADHRSTRDPLARRTRTRLGRGLLAVTAAIALLAGATVPLSAVAAVPVGEKVIGWGDNTSGQTVVPAGLTDVTALDGGNSHSLALSSDGTVTAWGFNGSGQTVVPAGVTDVTRIAAGAAHSLALSSDGTVTAWGDITFGQGVVPAGLTGVRAIAAGYGHNLVLKGDGTVTGWGLNNNGQTDVPAGLENVTAIAAGQYSSLALKADGTVTVWGDDPPPSGLENVTAIAAGGFHYLALKSDGTVVVWGNINYQPDGLTDVTAIAAGGYFNLALRRDGTVVAWGDNDRGQLDVPAGLTNVTTIGAGFDHGLAAGVRPSFTSDTPPATADLNAPFSYVFAATGATTYELATGTLPAGLSLSSDGVLSGTPTAEGDFTFTVSTSNIFGATTSRTITLTVTPAAPTISGAPRGGLVGNLYEYDFTVGGAPAPEVTVVDGTLPEGLSLDTTGRLSGTPTTTGTYDFTVRASNSVGSADLPTAVRIDPALTRPTIRGSAPDGTVGSAYDYTYASTGNSAPSFDKTGTLPPGLTLNRSTGRLSGTPTTAGTFTFTVFADNQVGSARITDTVVIAAGPVTPAAPAISGAVAAGVVGSAYDHTYTVTGAPAPEVTVDNGTLPPGLTLGKTGRLSGTPTKAGTYTYTVRATNSSGTATAKSTLTISPRAVTAKADLSVDIAAPTTATKGKQSTYTVTTKNVGPVTSTTVYSKVILPLNVKFVSATGKYTRIGNIVIFQRSLLTEGQIATETITVKATGTGTGTALAATFSVKTPDPSIRNNADTSTTTVR